MACVELPWASPDAYDCQHESPPLDLRHRADGGCLAADGGVWQLIFRAATLEQCSGSITRIAITHGAVDRAAQVWLLLRKAEVR